MVIQHLKELKVTQQLESINLYIVLEVCNRYTHGVVLLGGNGRVGLTIETTF
jgi:hypothetical protein